MRFDLIDMRLFLTVVEHGSLTQGAQAMNLALASVTPHANLLAQQLMAASPIHASGELG